MTARGNERREIYRDEMGRRHFLEWMEEIVGRFRLRVHALGVVGGPGPNGNAGVSGEIEEIVERRSERAEAVGADDGTAAGLGASGEVRRGV